MVPPMGFAGLAFTVVLVGFAGSRRALIPRRLGIILALVFLNVWQAPDRSAPSHSPDSFEVITRGIGIVDRYVGESPPRFLLAPLPKLGHYVTGLTSVYLWGYSIVTDKFPTVTPEQAGRVPPGSRVVVIAEQENAAASFDQVFASYGVNGHLMGHERLLTAQGPIYL